MQVLGGEAYQAQAAEQSVRELVVQPARGLIVDDMGRPLVANRTSWVVSLDRTMLHKMSDGEQATLLRRLSKAVGRAGQEDRGPHAALRRGRARSPGPAGTARPTSRCRSPRTSASRSRSRSWSRARTSRRCSWSRRTCAPTRRRTASTPRTCSATSARSPRTSSTRPRPRTTPPCTARPSSAGPGWRRSTTGTCAACPGYKRVAVDSMGRVLGDSGEVAGPGRRHPRHLDRLAGAGASSSSSSSRPSRPPARPSTRSPTATTSPTPAPSS